ncbi:hypothetical protein CTAYLR_006936 [Chrysophaeum taylorii]|uniref:Fe2OG dioxygenase domain-containing protein n=1 Tax=Chrysophaeum taylorii TaxID=2483200 RepID=A0AAD7UBK4_9STRA|nr:hypothetical protein CTAYLR_006936 [Chrysophaeum taylorii]
MVAAKVEGYQRIASEEEEEIAILKVGNPDMEGWDAAMARGCFVVDQVEGLAGALERLTSVAFSVVTRTAAAANQALVTVRDDLSVELSSEAVWRAATNGRWGKKEACRRDGRAVISRLGATLGSGSLFAPEGWGGLEIPRYSSNSVPQVRARLNGDFGSAMAGVPLAPSEFESLDDFVRTGCERARAKTIGVEGLVGGASGAPLRVSDHSSCEASEGARCFDITGTRISSLEQAERIARDRRAAKGYPFDGGWDDAAAPDLWFVPSGLHFVWPTVAPGHETLTVIGDDPSILAEVTTLSMQPAVFRIRGFLDAKEAKETVDRNRPRIKPSEVGLVGRAGDKTRTSSNAWDTSSPGARALINRAFRLLKVDPDRKLEDGLQVLHYENEQWYKPHVDYFTAKNGGAAADESAFSNANPTERNGTNRFATVFLYLSDAPSGGETVFPLSTTHLEYDGGRLTAENTVNTPGFIRNEDAEWVCDESSRALRVKPRVAEAVLFYSQRGDGSLDAYSLHGSCPIHEGEKWAANLWVWNRPRDAIDKIKSAAKAQFSVVFHNDHPDAAISLHWDDASTFTKMGDIQPGAHLSMNTFPGHAFVATPVDDPKLTLGRWTMRHGKTQIRISTYSPSKTERRPASPPKVFQ